MRRPTIRAGRAVIGGLVLAATVSAMTACTAEESSAGRSARAVSNPAVVLAASTEVLAEDSYRFEVTMGQAMSATGAVDPAAPAGEATTTLTIDGDQVEIESRFVGEDMWIKLGQRRGQTGFDTGWMHIDQSRIGEGGFAGLQPGELDLVGAAEMLRSLGTVEQVDDNTFRGEFTLTLGDLLPPAYQAPEALGEQSLTLEFEATVDDQGRLSRVVIEVPAVADSPAQQLEVRYFDFGSPVEVTPPPADQVTELPPEFYQLLGG